MKIVRGRDGRYAASQVGAMGRMVVADEETWIEAAAACQRMLFEQQAECYAHEQQFSHLSISLEPDGLRYQ